MTDRFGRRLDYLRVSVTDRCPARCVYCMPVNGADWIAHSEILRFEEILRIVKVMTRLGVSKIKVTGGEPLARRGIEPFIAALTALSGLSSVSLTTNAVLLEDRLDALLRSGLHSLTISLDALNEAVFRRITRIDALSAVRAGLDAALASGIPLKINCVLIAGYNEDEIVPIARLAGRSAVAVRFIELMPLGNACGLAPVPERAVVERIERECGALRPCGERRGAGPARYFSIDGFAGCIGFISALSGGFCASCNRLRLTSTGALKPCLAADTSIDLKTALRGGAADAELEALILHAAALKPASHHFDVQPQRPFAMMHAIGG